MVTYFSRRARVAGIVTGVLAVASLAGLHSAASREFTRLLAGPGLAFVIVSAAAVAAVFVQLMLGHARALRPLAALAVAAVIWGWGAVQYPYLLPRSLTVAAGSAPDASLAAILAVSGLAVALVGPGIVLLFTLRQRGRLHGEDERDLTEAGLPDLQAAGAVRPAGPGDSATAGPPPAGPRLRELAIAAVAFMAGASLASLARRRTGDR